MAPIDDPSCCLCQEVPQLRVGFEGEARSTPSIFMPFHIPSH